MNTAAMPLLTYSLTDDARLLALVSFATEVIGNGFVGLPFGAWLWVAAVSVPFGANAAALALTAILVFSIRPTRRPIDDQTSNAEPGT